MEPMTLIKEAARRSGTPITHIGLALGKRPNYVNAAMSKGSRPRVDVYASMLNPCGYVLAAMPAEDVPPSALVIDPDDAKPSA